MSKIRRANFTEEEVNEIFDLYEKGYKIASIAKKFKVGHMTIHSRLKRANKWKTGRGCRKFNCNFNYFDKIDTEDKAYWLGFIAADGCVENQKGRRVLAITLAEKDKSHLLKFLRYINGNYPIKTIKNEKSINKTNLVSLNIYNKHLTETLFSKGIIKNKTYFMNWKPFEEHIPVYLMRHFIRGYFDADGCWFVDKKSVNACFSIVCKSTPFLQRMNKEITAGSGIHYKPLNYHKKNDIFYFIRGGRLQLRKLYDYIYNDAAIFLERKRDKIEQYLFKIT